MLNCIKGLSKMAKLKFAFQLYDEEESKVIMFLELKKIIQANYFASNIQDVERKAGIILD